MSGDHSGRTPLHVASASGQIGMVQWLLKKGWGTENACFDGRVKCAKEISDHTKKRMIMEKAEAGIDNIFTGASVHIRDSSDQTPLMAAVQNGHLEVFFLKKIFTV